MNAELVIALAVQAVGVVALRRRLGKTWLRRPVTLLFLASIVDQGLSPVLLTSPAIDQFDNFRGGVRLQFIDQADLVLSVAMLALIVAYLLTRPERAAMPVSQGLRESVCRSLDWRLLAAACAPLAILTYEGRGYNDGSAAGSGTGVGTDLAATFLLLLAVLAAYGFILRYGSRWFLLVLAAQSLVLAAAGERTPVVADAIALVVLLAVSGVRVRPTQVALGTVLIIVAGLAIAGSRVTSGRQIYYRDSGALQRVTALRHGFWSAGAQPTSGGMSGFVGQIATRTDAPDFAGAILQAMALGQPRLNASYVPESLLEVVPSFLWPSKLNDLGVGSPQQVEINNFGLQQLNWIPGLPGMYIGFLTIPWLIAFMALLGLLGGWGERQLLARFSSSRMVWLAAAVLAGLSYEAGLPAILLSLRAGLVAAIATLFPQAICAKARKQLPPEHCSDPGTCADSDSRGGHSVSY